MLSRGMREEGNRNETQTGREGTPASALPKFLLSAEEDGDEDESLRQCGEDNPNRQDSTLSARVAAYGLSGLSANQAHSNTSSNGSKSNVDFALYIGKKLKKGRNVGKKLHEDVHCFYC